MIWRSMRWLAIIWCRKQIFVGQAKINHNLALKILYFCRFLLFISYFYLSDVFWKISCALSGENRFSSNLKLISYLNLHIWHLLTSQIGFCKVFPFGSRFYWSEPLNLIWADISGLRLFCRSVFLPPKYILQIEIGRSNSAWNWSQIWGKHILKLRQTYFWIGQIFLLQYKL